jgi:lipopolysaccharide transport system ATP-binding protein
VNIAISAEGLSKRYLIRHEEREHYTTLRDSITGKTRNILKGVVSSFLPLSSMPESRQQKKEDLWALKDVSFEVEEGDTVGIIGRNGAGKSTLLKILSRITEPTSGRVRLKGRVASLLEVGTGFHPELTGRENTFLSGAILGMTKVEIEHRFDEIVDFAEIEKFVDTPVKRYSSGMYVRLAFAVAAHLETEILLVDEVLAVGDIQFQKKCSGKMERAAREGKTVIVVSHNMGTIKSVCSRALLLENGRAKLMGSVDEVVDDYVGGATIEPLERAIASDDCVTISEKLRINKVRLLNGVGTLFSVYWSSPIRVALEIEVFTTIKDVIVGANIRTVDDFHILTVHSDMSKSDGLEALTVDCGSHVVEFTIENDLRPDIYTLNLGIVEKQNLGRDNLITVKPITFEVLPYSVDGRVPRSAPSVKGVVNGHATWTVSRIR